MSNEGNTAAVNAETENAVGELTSRYEDKGKVVALASDNQEDFVSFVNSIGEGNYIDWTKDVDANAFDGIAMVRTESGVNRLIPIASMATVLADPVVQKAAYKWYVAKVVNAAGDNDSTQSQFVIPSGNFKQKFDLEAYKFQARILTKFLRAQGLSGVTNASLRMAFASAAFAKTQFPRIDEKAWEKIIGIAEANAEKNGLSTSIFDHWKATRNVATADTSTLDLNFDKLQEMEAADSEEEGTTEAKA